MTPDEAYAPMAIDGHILQARDAFADFITTYAPPEGPTTDVFLEPLLAAWLTSGNGIDATAGLYDHFLQTAIAIIDATLTNTLPLDYAPEDVPQHPRHLIALEDPTSTTSVLSRLGHDRLVHETLETRRAEDLRTLFEVVRTSR